MLPSIETPFLVNGPSKKAIALGCGVSRKTLFNWSNGTTRIPEHKRQSFDRSLGEGAAMDWTQYDIEVDAVKRLSSVTAPAIETPANADCAPGEVPPAVNRDDGWGFM